MRKFRLPNSGRPTKIPIPEASQWYKCYYLKHRRDVATEYREADRGRRSVRSAASFGGPANTSLHAPITHQLVHETICDLNSGECWEWRHFLPSAEDRNWARICHSVLCGCRLLHKSQRARNMQNAPLRCWWSVPGRNGKTKLLIQFCPGSVSPQIIEIYPDGTHEPWSEGFRVSIDAPHAHAYILYKVFPDVLWRAMDSGGLDAPVLPTCDFPVVSRNSELVEMIKWEIKDNSLLVSCYISFLLVCLGASEVKAQKFGCELWILKTCCVFPWRVTLFLSQALCFSA